MSRVPSTSTLTMEFGHELETERRAWLRRRFMWYCAVMIVVYVISFLGNLVAGEVNHVGWRVYATGMAGIKLAVFAGALYYIASIIKPRYTPMQLAHWMILGLGLLTLSTVPITTHYANKELRRAAERGEAGPISVPVGNGGHIVLNDPKQPPQVETDGKTDKAVSAVPEWPENGKPFDGTKYDAAEDNTRRISNVSTVLVGGTQGVWSIFASHFLACCFLPWTPRESLRPIVPLLAVNAMLTGALALTNALGANDTSLMDILWIALALLGLSFLVPLPGVSVCFWRHNRFRHRATFDVLRDRYSALKHELTSARQIHESLFPPEITTGHCLFRYTYEPMRQIGGDFLHTYVSPAGSSVGVTHSIVILDVTGHGIPAALTVNRLHGELARIFAENPATTPGDVLKLLNSYVHLTLATHSVYVTAICFRISADRNTLEYASGGHPPAFVRSVDGRIDQLESTSLVLGAAAGPDFNPDARSLHFGAGDTLIAYTDGATEARDVHGRYFGIDGIQKLLAVAQPDQARGWPVTLLQAIERHREGPTMDDVLLIEIRRPVGAVLSA